MDNPILDALAEGIRQIVEDITDERLNAFQNQLKYQDVQKEWMSVKELSAWCGISQSKIQKDFLDTGRLPYTMIDGCKRIRLSDAREFFEREGRHYGRTGD